MKVKISKHKKHICKGFKPAGEMTLEETLYNLRNVINRGMDYNSQVINMAIKYIEQGEKYRQM